MDRWWKVWWWSGFASQPAHLWPGHDRLVPSCGVRATGVHRAEANSAASSARPHPVFARAADWSQSYQRFGAFRGPSHDEYRGILEHRIPSCRGMGLRRAAALRAIHRSDGDLEILKANIDLYAPKAVGFDFIQADSLSLTLLDKVNLTRTNGPFRLFSADGCYTREHTLNNLVTASECVSAGGVVILDDFMQPHWPGVTEAVNDFCRGNYGRMKPFLYAYHKLFFIGFGWHEQFFNACRQEFGSHPNGKVVEMFGSRVFSVYP